MRAPIWNISSRATISYPNASACPGSRGLPGQASALGFGGFAHEATVQFRPHMCEGFKLHRLTPRTVQARVMLCSPSLSEAGLPHSMQLITHRGLSPGYLVGNPPGDEASEGASPEVGEPTRAEAAKLLPVPAQSAFGLPVRACAAYCGDVARVELENLLRSS
jgi:hypothetical protein